MHAVQMRTATAPRNAMDKPWCTVMLTLRHAGHPPNHTRPAGQRWSKIPAPLIANAHVYDQQRDPTRLR